MLAWSTFLIAFWTMIPQIRSIRTYSHDAEALRGVSMVSLIVIGIDYAGWSAYGLLTAAWAIWIPSVFGVLATVITVIMLAKVRKTKHLESLEASDSV